MVLQSSDAHLSLCMPMLLIIRKKHMCAPAAGMNVPAQHVADAWQSAEFYANKVLMEHRNSPRYS